MGRKNNTKGKEKRLQRKEEQLKLSISKAAVDKANKLADPLEPFSVFRKFNKNGISADLSVHRITDLDESTKSWIFNLTKQNMQTKYEQCSWGWKDSQKLEELTDEAAWYLIARSPEGTSLGFSHFRFDLDYGDEVLYCYELQLESTVQRKGLGKFMMQILELMAFTNNMKKVVLTVLKHNKASDFFKAINYKLDETSPLDDIDNEYPYEILSKINKKLVVPPTHVNHVHSHCCAGHH
ncbi:N(alpha)-acetyltransferase 40 [Carabus blaptoides fortunei]